MQKGRNSYTLQLDCESTFAEKIIKDYLRYNGFHFASDEIEKVYKVGSSYSGAKCFSYFLSGHILVFHAWVEKRGVEYSVEQDRYNAFYEMYKDSLHNLFDDIANANNYVENAHHFKGNNTHGVYNTVNATSSDHAVSNPQKYNVNTNTDGNISNATGSLICGVMSMLLCFTALGIMVGIGGIFLALSQLNTENSSTAIVGLCTSIMGILISILIIL